MKKLLIPALLAILLIGHLTGCSNEPSLKISVTDSDDTYEFYAKYDKHKSDRVQAFINQKMAPSTRVTGDHVDITTTLDDKTEFKLEEYPGKVRVTLDKEANSNASYHRIKSMCEGIKKVIVEK